MKKIATFIVFTFIGIIFSFAQDSSENFLTWYITEYNYSKILHIDKNQWTNDDTEILKNQSCSLLTENDLTSINDVIKTQTEKTWDKSFFKTLGIKSVKTNFEKMNADEAYWSYAEPIFLQENTLCILKVNFVCGPTCQNYRIVLFKKINETSWEQLTEFVPNSKELLSAY